MKVKYLLILLIVTLNTYAYALSVTPNTYTTTQSNSYDTIMFNVTNLSNETVNVTITVDPQLQGKISFSTTSFSIQPNSTYTVIAVLSRIVPVSGFIHFNDVNVKIEVKRQNNLTVIPDTPSAGKGLVVLLQNQNATGYMFVYETNNVYPITIKNGIGFISLSDEDYGNAIIVVYGTKMYSRVISIRPPEIGSLYMIAPRIVKVNENVTITVYADGEPVRARLKFSGADNFAVRTNSGGVAKIRFKKPGNYTVTVEYFNYTYSQNFTVIPKTLDIQIPQSVKTGTTIQIKTEPDAKITIKKGDTTWSYTTNSDGVCTFTPTAAGRYEVIAKTDDAEGHATFTAKTDTFITLTSSEGIQVNKIREGDIIMLQVVSSDNSQPSGNIDIFIDGTFYKSLLVSNGVTLWKVDKSGNSYEFRFNPSSEDYSSASIVVQGEKVFNYMYVGIALFVLAIAGALYYAYNKGLLKLKLPSREKYKDLI
ncbi:MAG: hypothetical protein DRP18_04100 [Candidatus Aenigmatarchaeota archaeon]|nr:MAG: hypothetical protein DRP18_04100 [Candidatus Aenigmarchaeota archaeon]